MSCGSNILVSVCCITYNHAPFIRKAIDGFLMQQVNFSIEILIHDDCSTDGTTEIIREYESKYPDLIFPLYETENQYSKHVKSMDFYNYRRARGKYIAYCEGDDYWTDPLKLKKQVDFMEANPEYSLCFARNSLFNWFDSKFHKCPIDDTSPFAEEITAKDYLTGKVSVLPMTLLFRFSNFSYEWSKHFTQYVDTMEIYSLLKVGKGAILNFDCGVYNCHSGGVSSSNPPQRRSYENLRDSWEFYRYFGDDATKDFYIGSIMWRLDVCSEFKMKKEFNDAYRIAFKHSPRIALGVFAVRLKRKIKFIIRKNESFF